MNLKKTMRCVLLIAVLGVAACSGERLQASSEFGDGPLGTCPESPNCVSSLASVDSQRVDPLRYEGASVEAHQRLIRVLRSFERVRITQANAKAIHVEFRSALFGFVDDVDLRFNQPGVIQIRSAARVGYSDFGVNRERVEAIRARFEQAPTP